MSNLMNTISTVDFKRNPQKDGIVQSERNALRKNIIEDMVAQLSEVYPEAIVLPVSDGIAVSVLNETIGEDVTFIIDVTCKNFTYDIWAENEAFTAECREKAEKKERIEREKAKKIAAQKTAREEK
jgi:hypothetical protein